MPLLAIDTSAAISAALIDDAVAPGTVLAQATHDSRRLHAELLAPTIHGLLQTVGIQPRDLTAIAVGTGPGPFTGLRIGLVTAETLAFALDIPLYGVCSLEALAAFALAQPQVTQVVATLDARRKEIYWAEYQNSPDGPVELTPPQVTAPDMLPSTAQSPRVGFLGAEQSQTVPAEWIGRLALIRAAHKIPQPTRPLYLRRPDIQGQAPQAI